MVALLDNCLGLFKFLHFRFFALCILLFCFVSLFFGFILVASPTPSEPFVFPSFFSPSLTSFQMARTKTTSNPPSNRLQGHWASEDLLAETFKLTSGEDVAKHREDEAAHMTRVFGGKRGAYVSVCPCAEGEPVCVDYRVNYGEPFFFLSATIFKRVKLRLPLTGFERALLTEINVAPAQLHPNDWAFVRAVAILCNHLGFNPSVDVFLYFF